MTRRAAAWAISRRLCLGLAAAGALCAVAKGADETPRITYVVGPVPPMPSGDAIIHALLGRLEGFDLAPSVRQVGIALEFTVNATADPDFLAQILTRPGRLSIHADVEKVMTCEGQGGGALCLPGTGEGTFFRLSPTPTVAAERLASAEAVDDPSGARALSLRFDAEGTRALGALTSERTGEMIAVVLDGVVFAAPRVMSPILGGTAVLHNPDHPADLWAAFLDSPPLPEALSVFEIRKARTQ